MRKFLYSSSLSVIFLLSFTTNIYAQVVINEVLNNPTETEAGAEWVELFNLAESPASLKGCALFLDDSSSSQKVIFSDEDFIDKYKVITWDSSWLNNSGDLIKLTCTSHEDSVAYGNQVNSTIGAPPEGVTFGRSPDGNGSFSILSTVTLGNANSTIFIPSNTPSPTERPTSTPRPTVTPKPTSTNKPTQTLRPSNSPTITVTKQISLAVDSNNEENMRNPTESTRFLANVDTNKSDTKEDEDENKNTSQVLGATTEKGNFTLPLTVGFLGFVILIFSFYPILKNYKKRYNSKNESD